MSISRLESVSVNGRTVDIILDGDRNADLVPVAGQARAVALPLTVDPHVHLDKTLLAGRVKPEKPGLFGAIEAMEDYVATMTSDDVAERAGRALEMAWSHGAAALRSHVDWTTPDAPAAWEALGELAGQWRGRLQLQRASLCPVELLGDRVAGEGIARRVARDGAVLGAWMYRNEGLEERLDVIFDLAERYDLPLDFHVDEGLDPDANALDLIIERTEARRLGGRVLCSHACSLSIRNADDAQRTILRAAGAGIAMTVLPLTNAYLQDMEHGRTPRLRGLAPLVEMRRAGMRVLLGADNVGDGFFPYGNYDAVETLRHAVFLGQIDPDVWIEAITTGPADVLGFELPRLRPGDRADFIVIEGANMTDVISHPRNGRHIWRSGKIAVRG